MPELISTISFLVSVGVALGVAYYIYRTKTYADCFDLQYIENGYGPGFFRISRDDQVLLSTLTLIQVVSVLWIYANIPEIKNILVATFYLFMVLLSFVILKLEYLFPRLSEFAVVGFGDRRDLEKQLLTGVIIGVTTLLVFSTATALQVKYDKTNLAYLLVTILISTVSVPFIEEMFFGNILAATITERFGILAGIFLPAFIFSVFHGYAYDLDAGAMFGVFVFRALSSLALIKYESFLPGLVGHILVNTISTLEGLI